MISTTVSPPVDDKEGALNHALPYPLRFEPIYQYRLWGGRHLANLLTVPLPSGAIGEAWLLSDRDDHQSRVTDGPLKGQTIGQLLQQFPKQLLGKLAGRFRRFPLLLKFLDAHEMLSVQVHPTKANPNMCESTGTTVGAELNDAIQQGTAVVAESEGRMRAYASSVAFFGHDVGEANRDLQALIAAAKEFQGPGILVPTRNAGLFRWCLESGLRVVQPMTLMTTGLYNEPAGAYLPSILF